jgi:hypothetical protein
MAQLQSTAVTGSLTTTGNVGVGTISLFSGTELDVWGDITLANQNWALRGNNANADLGIEELIGSSFSDANIRLYMQAGGNVGIGTANPEAKLDVRAGSGFIRLGSYNDNYHVKIEGGDQLNFYNGASNAVAYINYNGPSAVLLGRNLYVEGNSGGGVTGAVRVTAAGNVGIGTDTPAGKFEIKSAAQSYTTAPAITFTDNTGVADSRWILGNIATTYGAFNLAEAASATSTSYTARLTILPGGNVGINTTVPVYNLQVLNTIGLRANSASFQAIKGTYWGYSTSYPVVMLGNSNPSSFTTVSIGYDPSGNANAAFTGDGREVLFRRGAKFVTPNSADNSFYLNNLVLLDGAVGIGSATPASILNTSGANNGITHDDSTEGKGYIRFRNAGTQLALFGIAGAWEGSSLQDTMIAAETGLNIRFYTNGSGTPKMLLDTVGNLGIGLTNPSAKLDVNGDTYIRGTEYIFKAVNSTTGYLYFDHSGTQVWKQGIFNDNTSTFSIGNGGGFTRLFNITNAGLVGIGTTIPENTLHVYKGSAGTVTANANSPIVIENSTNAYLNILVPDANESGILFGRPTSDVDGGIIYNSNLSRGLEFRTAGNDYKMGITSTGNVGIGLTNPATKLDVDGSIKIRDGNNLTWGGAYGSGIPTIASAINFGIYFYPAGSTSGATMRIDSNGNVGIGTANPSYRLDVRSAGVQTTPTMRIWNTNTSWQAETTIRAFADVYSTVYSAVDFGFHRGFGSEATSGFIVKTGTDASTSIKLFVQQGGNVGIGMTNPQAVLDINYKDSNTNIVRVSNGSGAYRWRIDQNFDMFMTNASFADTAGIKNSGEAFFTGNVGIGTATPAEKLDVVGRVKITQSGYGWIYGNDVNHSIILRGNRDGTAQDYTNYYQYGGTLAAGKGHLFWTEGVLASQRLKFQIADDGIYSTVNVGIGTIAPQSNLDIYTTYSSSNKSLIARNGAGTINTQIYDTVVIQQADVTTLRMVERNVGGTDQLLTLSIGDGYGRIATTAQPLQFFVNGSTTGLGYQGLGGTLAMTIATNGNVGINTSSPTHKLDVRGSLRVDSNTSFANTYAAAPNTIIGNKEDEQCLGTPDEWLAINVSGTEYAVPLYSIG